MNSQPRLPVALPPYEAELATHQRAALRTGSMLAAALLLAFALLDLVQAPHAFWMLLAVRVVAAAGLATMSRMRARSPPLLAAVAVAVICATIDVAAFASGGVHSPYLISNIAVLAGVGMLVPLSVRQAALVQCTGLAVVLLPLFGVMRRGEALVVATTASYLVTIAIVAIAGASLQDSLRRREHRARIEVARQMGLINLGTLAGGLAHELASPLTFVGIELDGLEAMQLDPKVHERVRAANAGLARMRDTLLAMRQGARFASNEVREVQLAEEVDLALTLVAQRLRNCISVQREYDPLVPLVSCQPTLLGQVLVNLFLNAVDAMAGQKEGRLTVRVLKNGENALVEVEDTGPGVPPEIRARIFEPFFSTKGEKGNGLGLWISSEIARVHGGDLSVHPGTRGACFQLALPVERTATISAA